MDAIPDPAPAKLRHLRLVGGDADGAPGAAAGRESLARDQRAAAIRREAAALAAVRGDSHVAAYGGSNPSGGVPASTQHTGIRRGGVLADPLGAPCDGSAPRADTASLSERWEALAADPFDGRMAATAGHPEDARFDRALRSLTAASPLDLEEQLRPAAVLPALQRCDTNSAGRWLLAMLPLLHEAAPLSVLEIRLDRRKTVRAVAFSDETKIDLSAGRSRRLARASGDPGKLVGLALGLQRERRREREGVALLRRLARHPVSIGGLAASGASAIDPFAFWSLVRVARPAAPDCDPATFVHCDPSRVGGDVTVRLSPGRPLTISRGATAEADAVVASEGAATLLWAAFAERSGTGSEWLLRGDPDVELAALRVVGRACPAPIRTSDPAPRFGSR